MYNIFLHSDVNAKVHYIQNHNDDEYTTHTMNYKMMEMGALHTAMILIFLFPWQF